MTPSSSPNVFAMLFWGEVMFDLREHITEYCLCRVLSIVILTW